MRDRQAGCILGADQPGPAACADLHRRPPRGRGAAQRQGLGEQLDVLQAAAADLGFPAPVRRLGRKDPLPHLLEIRDNARVGPAHRQHLAPQGFKPDRKRRQFLRIRLLRRIGWIGRIGQGTRQHGDHPGAGQGEMLPGPGLVHLVGAERFEGRRDRPLPPRRAQPHVHLVKPARRGRRGDGGQKGLRQARIIGARRQGPWPRGPLGLGRVVDHDQVQVRGRVQLPRAQRAHAQHRCPVPGRRTVAARELGRDHGRQGCQRRVRDVGVLLARFLGLDQPAQVVDAHAELPFVRPAPGGVERPFIPAIGGGHRAVERGRQFGTHRLESRPRREEAARQHRVQHLGVARQISGQARRGRADVAQKVDQRGVRFEH